MKTHRNEFHGIWVDKCLLELQQLIACFMKEYEAFDDGPVVMKREQPIDTPIVRELRQRMRKGYMQVTILEAWEFITPKQQPVDVDNKIQRLLDTDCFSVYKSILTRQIKFANLIVGVAYRDKDHVVSNETSIWEVLQVFDNAFKYCYQNYQMIQLLSKGDNRHSSLSIQAIDVMHEKVSFMNLHFSEMVSSYSSHFHNKLSESIPATLAKEGTTRLGLELFTTLTKQYKYYTDLCMIAMKILDELGQFDISINKLSLLNKKVVSNPLQPFLSLYNDEYDGDPLGYQLELYLTIRSVLPSFSIDNVSDVYFSMAQLAVNACVTAMRANQSMHTYHSVNVLEKARQYKWYTVMQQLINTICVDVLHSRYADYSTIKNAYWDKLKAKNPSLLDYISAEMKQTPERLKEENEYRDSIAEVIDEWSSAYRMISTSWQYVNNVMYDGHDDQSIRIVDVDSMPVRHCQIGVWLALLSTNSYFEDFPFLKSVGKAFRSVNSVVQFVGNIAADRVNSEAMVALIQYYEEYLYWLDIACQLKLLQCHIISIQTNEEVDSSVKGRCQMLLLSLNYIQELIEMFMKVQESSSWI